jgi:hypothetical protein
VNNMPFDIPIWEWPPWIWFGIIGIAAAGGGGWGFILWRRLQARRRLENTISSVAYDVLRNVLVPNGMGGEIHLNYLLLTERGLLVIDLFDLPGAIFSGDQMIEWTAIGRKRRFTFPNPQHLLYDRIAAVKLLAEDVPVDGRIVFALRSEFPKGKTRYVLRIDELTREYSLVDRTRGNITAAFADVWQNVKKNSHPNPLS